MINGGNGTSYKVLSSMVGIAAAEAGFDISLSRDETNQRRG